ncbi:MAG: hypothetical protein C4530_05375 [Desulfobacteraceae bacterium]|nr:MAG: hypothetical protein C4530_05375 [Desulfobacteraceae bacterium]
MKSKIHTRGIEDSLRSLQGIFLRKEFCQILIRSLNPAAPETGSPLRQALRGNALGHELGPNGAR